MKNTTLTPICFHNDTIYAVEHNGELFTPMKPIDNTIIFQVCFLCHWQNPVVRCRSLKSLRRIIPPCNSGFFIRFYTLLDSYLGGLYRGVRPHRFSLDSGLRTCMARHFCFATFMANFSLFVQGGSYEQI